MAKKVNAKAVTKWLSDNAIIVMIVLAAIFTSTQNKNFYSINNIRNLLSNTAVRFIIACGVSGCLITKGTDLSAGRVMGLAACLSGILMQKASYSDKFYPNLPELPLILVLVMVMLLCGLIGAVNGSVIAFLKVPPFIATLGMQTLVYGACLIYTGAIPIGGLRNDYTGLATGYVGTRMLSNLTVIAIGVGLIMWFLYNKTRYGKYMYAIGGNESAATVAGVNVPATLIRIYILASLMYALGGFLVGAKAGGASTATGLGYELEAIAACTIGGVSANGGVGTVPGVLVGVLVFEVLKICLQFMGVDPAYTYIAQGLVIIVAVALDLRKYLAKK